MTGIQLGWVWVQRMLRVMDERNLGLIAAGVAFYAILSVFPGLAAVIALWGVIGDPGLIISEMSRFDAFIPPEVSAVLQTQLEALAGADGLTLGWASALSLILAVWSARAGVAALIRGLNAIYNVPNRSGLAHYLQAIGLTVALIGVALVAMVCVVILPVVLALLPQSLIPIAALGHLGFDVGRWLLALGVLLVGFSLIYRLGPNARGRRNVPGAVCATLLWAVGSYGFSVYLTNFASYNEVYGSIGAVIALLMWLFLSAWLVLLGGAVNVWLSEGKQTKS
ncbi:MAG: YihY/virulence factor BrkB family protein [Paracoccaceae bacterium]